MSLFFSILLLDFSILNTVIINVDVRFSYSFHWHSQKDIMSHEENQASWVEFITCDYKYGSHTEPTACCHGIYPRKLWLSPCFKSEITRILPNAQMFFQGGLFVLKSWSIARWGCCSLGMGTIAEQCQGLRWLQLFLQTQI